MQVPRLVSMPDSSKLLGGIGRTKLYELVRRGEVTRVKLGARSFITADSLANYLDRLVVEAGGSTGDADARNPKLAGGDDR